MEQRRVSVWAWASVVWVSGALACAGLGGGLTPGPPPVKLNRPAHSDAYGDALPEAALARLGTSRLYAQGDVTDLRLSRDGTTLITADAVSLTTWDVRTGEPTAQLRGYPLGGALDLSPDGGLVAASVAESVYLFTPGSKALVGQLGGARQDISSLVFSPDAKYLAAGSRDRMVRVWKVDGAETLFTLDGHTHPVTAVAWSPADDRIASASSDGAVRLWDPFTGDAKRPPLKPTDKPIGALAFSPDGKQLALDLGEGVVGLMDLDRGSVTKRLTGTHGPVRTLTFDPSGDRLIVGGQKAVAVWDVDRASPVRSWPMNAAAAVSADGNVLAAGQGALVHLWLNRSGRVLRELERHTGPVQSVAFTASGDAVLTTSADRTARLWATSSGAAKGRWDASLAALSPDGAYLARVQGDAVVVEDPRSGRPIRTFGKLGGAVKALRFAPTGARLAALIDGQGARLWSPVNGKQLASYLDAGVNSDVLAFTPDGQGLITAIDRTLTLRDALSGDVRYTLADAHAAPVSAVAVSADSQRLLSCDGTDTAVLWDLTKGTVATSKRLPRPCAAVAASPAPDRALWAVGYREGMVEVWEQPDLRRLIRFTPHAETVRALAFDPKGGLLATGSDDATSMVWNLKRLEPQRRIVQTQRVPGLPNGALQRLGSRNLKHDGNVTAAVWSPNGQRVATAAADRTARVWASADGAPVADLAGFDGVLQALAFSPDGATVAGAGDSGVVHLWDAASGAPVKTLEGFAHPILSLAFSPDGLQLAVAGRTPAITVFDVAAGAPAYRLQAHTDTVHAVAFAPNGKRIASASADGLVIVWLLAKNNAPWLRFDQHTGGALALGFSQDGRYLATTSADNKVHVWSILSGDKVHTLEAFVPQQEVGFSASGALASTGPGYITLWDTRAKAPRKLISTPTAPEHNLLQWHPSQDGLLSASGEQTVRFWAAESGEERLVAPGHQQPVTAVAVDAKGDWLATASADRTVLLWDQKTGAIKASLRGHSAAINRIGFVPGKPLLVSASDDGQAMIWSVPDGALKATLQGHTGPIHDLAFDADGRNLYTGSGDGSVTLWNTRTGVEITSFRGQGDPIQAVAISRDGRTLIYAGTDGTIRTWSTASFEPMFALGDYPYPITHLRMSPDGKVLASANARGQIRIWDVAKRTVINAIETQPPADLAFSPNGATLAIADSASIVLVDVVSGRTVLHFQDLPSPPNALAFSPSGDRLYSGHSDSTVLVWSPGKLP